MKWLERLDAWLIASPFQWLVDAIGKKREWWVEQCAYAYLVCGLMDSLVFFRGEHQRWVLAGLTLIVAGFILLDAKVPALLERTAGLHNWRRGFLVLWLVNLPLDLVREMPGAVVGIFAVTAMVSSYYFAACQPPRPRQPRRKLAPGGV
jgi:hypothetical protein